MHCFNGNYATHVFDTRRKRMLDEIASLDASSMNETDREAWIDYFCSKFTIEYLIIHRDSIELDLVEKKIRICNQWARIMPYEPEFCEVPGFCATCKIYYTGNPMLLELTPSTHTLDNFEVETVVKPDKDGVGYFILAYELTQNAASSEKIQEYFRNRINAFVKEAERVNKDVESFNGSLQQHAEQAIDKRINEIDKFATIRQGLNLPLNRVKNAPMIKPVPLPQKKLTFSIPKPVAQGPSYCINDSDYLHITEIIDGCCSMMEQAPGSYQGFEEEQLRDHILSVLNTHYENSTGETFRRNGKTDINIPFENHAAYIAECKIWHGKKAFLAAIDQLFSYTTWRDTKVSVIIFNKENKNFERVLETIQNAINEVSVQDSRIKHSEWRCAIQNKSDERVMHVTVQAFDLHV